MDVSYNSVLGDIDWTGDGLKSECISSSSLVSYGVFSPVPVLYCNSRWLILHFEGGLGRGESGLGGVIFERGGRFFERVCVKKKNKKRKRQRFIFYPLSIFGF